MNKDRKGRTIVALAATKKFANHMMNMFRPDVEILLTFFGYFGY
jgi:hypothetical protein